MSKHVHLAREYFSEGEIRDLLQNSNITKQNLHDFSKKRKVFYSRDLERKKKSFDLARLFIDWNEFKWLAEKLDRPRKKSKSRPMHFDAEISHDDIVTAMNQLKVSRGADNYESYTLNEEGSRSIMNSQYVEVDPSKAKYHQREVVNTEVEFVKGADGSSTIIFEDDKRAEQIVNALVGELRKTDDKYLDRKLDKLELTELSSKQVSTFFLELISSSSTYKSESAVKVKLQKPQTVDDDLDEDSDVAAAEVQHQLQNALLQGEGILETSFFQVLQDENYYLCLIQWRFNDEANRKKVLFEAGLRNPKEQTDFYVEVSGIMEMVTDGEYTNTYRQPHRTEKNYYTDIFTKLAFSLKPSNQ